MAEITLTSAIFGMGNPNHDHVFRHNTFNISSENIDIIKLEQHGGGVVSSTIGNVANQSAGLSAQPQGYVNVEEGFNLRRGIAMLKFIIDTGAMVQTELAVIGYLHGGGFSIDGIDPDVMFTPVRTWETQARVSSQPDLTGYPQVKRSILNSNQLLLGDVNLKRNLQALRPMDLGNNAIGSIAVEEDWGDSVQYNGTLSADLSSNPVMSKMSNLDPTYFARQALRMATHNNTMGTGDVENSVADFLGNASMREQGINENAFFTAMNTASGQWRMAGFNGYSVGEISGVFTNFADVLNLNLLEETSFAVVDNTLTSHEYGSSSPFEYMATEVAMITLNLLMDVGLASLQFSATNNPEHTGGMIGSEDGIVFIPGEVMSLMDHDDHVINKVEAFKQRFNSTFFGKYTGTSSYNTTIANIEVFSSIFGETSVNIALNGELENGRNFVNATYVISRSSSNIAVSEVAMGESRNFVSNLKDYFTTD